MTENPTVTYINKPAFPYPTKQRYHLRALNWIYPYPVPLGHKVVVSINGKRTEAFDLHSSVVILKEQPNDFDEITITTEINEDYTAV